MFDKLIESNSAGAEFKPRRKFFMVSSVVVGILFLSAVVFSLYAQDIDLGTDDFELAELIAPVAPDAPEPEPPRQQPQQASQQPKSELPSRQDLIAQIDQPQRIPDQISTIPNTLKPIPEGPFVLNPRGPEHDRIGSYNPVGTGSSAAAESTEIAEVAKVVEPPPISPKPELKKPVTLSKGVVNGTAKYLPVPPYPPAAKAIGIAGDVNVQVLINEQGDVVSAQAITGHVTLKAEAERAARRAKFRPTLLSGEPVKVTGVIIYRFSR
ncbi:MAG TPA: TonB family protein [Pyrinomonadaceae bacterium]